MKKTGILTGYSHNDLFGLIKVFLICEAETDVSIMIDGDCELNFLEN